LQLQGGGHPNRLALQPGDRIEIDATPDALAPRAHVPVHVVRRNGQREALAAVAAVETQLEVKLLRQGGVMPAILRQQAQTQTVAGADRGGVLP
jgi:aconitate hydratase